MFAQRGRSTSSFTYKNLMTFKYSNSTTDRYLYLMVGTKYGNAIKRNQLKRWVRITYHQTLLKYPNLGLMVRPINTELVFKDVQLCFQKLMLQLEGSKNE